MKLHFHLSINLFILSIFIFSFALAQKPVFTKAGSINGDSSETCKIVTDSRGSVYIAGVYNSTSLDFGGAVSITNPAKRSIYLARYDASGSLIWAKSFGGVNNGKIGAFFHG